MRPNCFLPLVGLFLLTGAVPCGAHPRAECAATRCDYGSRLPGPLPPAVFTIINRGDQPLHLNPQPCCGISVTGAEPAIRPGESRQLSAQSPHPLGEGLFRKTIRVLTNDPDHPELQLEIVAMGENPIQLFPGDELTFPLDDAAAPRSVLLRSNDEPELTLTSIRCSAPYLHCREVPPVLPKGEKPDRYRQLEITVAPDAPKSVYEATIMIGTSCRRRPQLKLRVYGVSPTAVTAQPPRLDFDPLGKNEASAARVLTLTRSMGPFKVLGVSTSDPRMQVTVNTDPSGMFAELVATFRPGTQRGPFQGTVTVRTDDPERPKVVIAYTGEAE